MEKILEILGTIYPVRWENDNKIIISIPESPQHLEIKIENDTAIIYKEGEIVHVLSLDQDAGQCALSLEKIIISEFNLYCGTIAFAMYLYCKLLGILWGIKASSSLKNKCPVPDHVAYIKLHGNNKNNVEYTYQYMIEKSGRIAIEKSWYEIASERFSFMPEEYLEDPENIIIKFFDFFKDIKEIQRIGKG